MLAYFHDNLLIIIISVVRAIIIIIIFPLNIGLSYTISLQPIHRKKTATELFEVDSLQSEIEELSSSIAKLGEEVRRTRDAGFLGGEMGIEPSK